MRLEEVTPSNWREFLEAPAAVMLLGKEDCENCKTWSAELVDFLETDETFTEVRFGKLMINEMGFSEFKREHGEWLAHVSVLPYNLIIKDGVIQKRYAGGGLQRLLTRLGKVMR